MKKMIVKNWKRIAAVIMAAIMVMGSVNLSDIVVNAVETNGDSYTNPYYDEQDGYVYDRNDIFGAATHVHLFGRVVTSTAHTHGNVFATEALLSEYGTRDGNNVLHNPIPLYDEVSYIRNTLHNIDSSSRINTLVVGKDIYTGQNTDGRYLVRVDDGTRKLDQTDHVYMNESAINFEEQFAYLEGLSKQWANDSSLTITANSKGNSCDISWNFTDPNRRQIILEDNVGRTTNTVLTIPYDVWNGAILEIRNLDGTMTNRGILVINIDMAGASEGQTLNVTGGGAQIYTTTSGDKAFGNREYRTDEYGACRIVYNIIDSSNTKGGCLYEGKFDFGDSPSFGSILAPKAHAVVGAVNGTVIADTIDHVGNESHRMDIWALNTTGSDSTESTVDIVIHKMYYDSNGNSINLRDVFEEDINNTVFGLYRTSDCSGAPIDTVKAGRDGNNLSFAIATFSRDCGDLANGETTFYIKEIRTGNNYIISDEIFTCVITKNQNGVKVSYGKEDTEDGTVEKYFECHNTQRTEDDPAPSRSVIYNETIGLQKIFDGITDSPNKDLLGGTVFTLYGGYDPIGDSLAVGNNARITTVKMVDGKAVVEFKFPNGITIVENEGQHYYIKETSTVAPYTVSDNIYEFWIHLDSNTDDCVVEYRLIKDANGIHRDARYSLMTEYPTCTNTKDSETSTPETVDYTIGLIKDYDGLTLTSLGNSTQIQEFLNGTDFEFIEVNENGQPVSGATATTLHPAWDGNHAVVSQKITITKGGTRYYEIRETKASAGFEMSADVYMWKVTCSDTGVVSAGYKIGDAAYRTYTANTDYPKVTNARVPYSGTISLIKTYQDVTLTALGEDARTNLLNGTTFALYDNNNTFVREVHPVWENNQAVVKFALNDLTIDVGKSVVYYIRETAASTGYVKSDVVYECQIRNVNGQYEVGYRAGNNGDYVSAITCNNVKQTVKIDPVTVVINKTFNDSFFGLSGTQIPYLLSETKFAFYENENCTNKVNDFTLQAGSPARSNGGTVTYTYDYTGTLSPGDQRTYYVRETATNESIYTMDPAVYKIVITVGEAENGIANQTIKPSVEYYAYSTNGNKVSGLIFTNTRIPKAQSPATITFTKVFENDFSNVADTSKVNDIISNTSFTLYNDSDCMKPVTGFSNPTTNRNNENVTYEYSLTISSLDVDKTYYYYLKETYTDPNYYRQNDNTYVVRITIDADGKPTVGYAEYQPGIAREGLSYSDSLKIENTQVSEGGATQVLNSPVITFTKVFDDFEKFTDGNAIVEATTFTLTAVDGAETIGFRRLSPNMTDNGAIYSYQLDLSGVDPSAYTDGTYYIEENRTDSRYTNSTEVLEIKIEVTDGEAKATFVGNNTFRNTLKSDNPQQSPPVENPPSTPSTPSNSDGSGDSGTSTPPPTGSTPSTPSTPTTPDTPNSWVTPDGKVHYEILIEYEHIDSSSTPERIEELIENTTIRITDQNGNDVTEHVTKITWDPSRNVAIVTVEAPKPSEGFDTYYVVEDTDPADNDLSHSEPGRGFTVAITSDGKVLFQEDGSATPTTEMRFVNVETDAATSFNEGGGSPTLTSMTSAQTGERKLPWAVFGGGMSMIFIAGTVYVFKKKEKIER